MNQNQTQTSAPHLLLVTPDPVELERLAQGMRKVSYPLHTLSEVSQVLPQILRFHYRMVVLGDFNSSLQILEQIKQLSPKTTVILISKKATVSQAVLAMRLGAHDYLENSCDILTFQTTIQQGLQTYHNRELPCPPPSWIYTDEITGLFNMRYLKLSLEKEMNLSRDSNQSFALLFIDVDHFKQINDHYGHWMGNLVLSELGSYLKKQVRKKDQLFRYGGDEFIALLSACNLPTALKAAERIRRCVQNRVFLRKERKSLQMTLSIGLSLFPQHGKTSKELLEAADQAMYLSKKASKNQISVSDAIFHSNPSQVAQ